MPTMTSGMSAITVTDGLICVIRTMATRDDDQPDHDVVDQNDEERDFIHIGFEAADGFAWRIGQRRCAWAAQDVAQQILAQQRGHVREDGHIGIIKTIAGDDAPDPCGG